MAASLVAVIALALEVALGAPATSVEDNMIADVTAQ